MWQSVLSLITLLLPSVLKIVGYLIDKKKDSETLKEEFLKFINAIEKDVPLKLRQDYHDQIARIREKLRSEEAGKATPMVAKTFEEYVCEGGGVPNNLLVMGDGSHIVITNELRKCWDARQPEIDNLKKALKHE